MSTLHKSKKPKERTPEQDAARKAARDAESSAARLARLTSHNAWPAVTLTNAETKFSKLLKGKSGADLLKPYAFHDVGGRDFHRHLGMLIDGLEMLPNRPDHAFDFFFRTVDELSQQRTSKNKITDAMESLGPSVCTMPSNTYWKPFINLFSERLPKSTAMFMAQRLLKAFGTDGDPIKPRGNRLLTEQRYKDFHEKFKGALANEKDSSKVAQDAGLFIRHLINNRTATEKTAKGESSSTLNLKDSKNTFDESRALWALMSLMAFTSRNERFHGSSLSPFRSSLADESTYASYYFQMLFVYTLAVGLMIELFEGCGDMDTWRVNMNDNAARLDAIFKKWMK